MGKLLLLFLLCFNVLNVSGQVVGKNKTSGDLENSNFACNTGFVAQDFFAGLTNEEKKEAIISLFNESCTYRGIKLYGNVEFVTSFPDIKIQFVENLEDIKVKFVSFFPDECGLWRKVSSFPDFKVQIVDHLPDLKVKVVEHFPGVD